MKIVDNDPWLQPVADKIEMRNNRYCLSKENILHHYGSLYDFAGWHRELGFHYDKELKGWYFRDWLPRALQVYLTGSFADWEPCRYPLSRRDNGVWEVFLPIEDMHGEEVMLYVKGKDGYSMHLPAYVEYATQDAETNSFVGRVWAPAKPFDWQDDKGIAISNMPLLIYECHIGMAQEVEGVGTYKQFEENIIPYIKDLGYNVLQIMAIAEHPYYGSYGYQVSNFFAPSSRFGTPDDLKHLIRTAHSNGIAVVMDLVQGHYVANTTEGLNMIDGDENLYSPKESENIHPYWETKLFDYSDINVQRFLLSNIRYWMEEYHIDGFRFDGVTSMIYMHHGYIDNFGTYDNYFGTCVNEAAITYLTLANDLIHNIRPDAVTIAEEVSGMPGMVYPIADGGVGFDYRLAMALPDYWIKLLKEQRDEQWSMADLWKVMNDRLFDVKTVAYCESHDQAMVGDKTIAFRLMDKTMYNSMLKQVHNPVVDRGVALHKMIRFFTILVGGQAYLNFMGNEFGHPEWIDFPRKDNNWSYLYARRQWSLIADKGLKYDYLLLFDKAMLAFVKSKNVFNQGFATLLQCDEKYKTIVFSRGKWVAVFNWHSMLSVSDYIIQVEVPGKYRLVLSTDDSKFGGFDRLDKTTEYFSYTQKEKHYIKIYNINRSASVYEKV